MNKINTDIPVLDIQTATDLGKRLAKEGIARMEKELSKDTKVEKEGLAPGYYQDPVERMIADMHQAILDLRQEVHELRLAVVEMNRRQKLIEGDGK